MALINDLRDKGIGFRSLQENIDTTSGVGKLVFHIFASLAEFERDLIRECIASARARGRLGRRPKLLDAKKVALARVMHADKHVAINDICATLGVGGTTLYRYLKAPPGRGSNHMEVYHYRKLVDSNQCAVDEVHLGA